MQQIKRIFVILSFMLLGISSFAQVLIDWNADWYYAKGTSEPTVPNTLWRSNGFDVSGWARSAAPFRYGDGVDGTLLSDMAGNYSTCYLINRFNIVDAATVESITVTLDYDDGFVFWINGQEIQAVNAPVVYGFDQFATDKHEFGDLVSYTVNGSDLSLVNGLNTIAIQGFNESFASTDFYLNARVEVAITQPILPALPETDKVTIHSPSGFYAAPFNVSITSASGGETVKYTLDGSDPRFSASAITVLSPLSVAIDPASTNGGRGATGGVVLRASKFETGLSPSKPVTRTYLFATAIRNQGHPGGPWPTTNVNGQIIDLEMDASVTGDNRYKYEVENALKDIPTISVTTDMAHLFSPTTGIYVNAQYHGDEWERPANFELINPDGTPGFNIDAGLRIRGGWSRHPNYPKHAFRVFFSSVYGESKLRFPLFGEEGVSEFDKIDLRTAQNYSWANGGSYAEHNTMNRDVFSRDCQRDMNRPYTRSRYYHLYLNGLYWGLYQTQERAEAAFAESYFGGDREDYDVIKVDIGDNFNLYEIEATDGNTDAWNEVWNMCATGFATNGNYFKLLGSNALGEPDTSLTMWVDVDNLIDYMMIIFYTGNFDAPVSKFSNNYNPNNFFAIYDRSNKRRGFKFLQHDSEHTLLTDAVSPGIGINENRVSIGMNVSYFAKFHPQWLHARLVANAEYRMRFADRVYRHFFNQGVLTPDSCISRFNKTAIQIDKAIIAESARWGDSGSWPARTRDDDWLPAVNRVVDDYMPFRSDIVLTQLIAANLYGALKPPVFKSGGIEVVEYNLVISDDYHFSIQNPNASGTLYYTTDGTDPRAIGGDASITAISSTTTVNVSVGPGNTVKARIQYMDKWSALREIYFQDGGLLTNLKITELHYHPLDQNLVEGKEFEFVELKNVGPTTLDLSGVSFTEGITFAFPEGTSLAPQAFVVVASNPAAFATRYGFTTEYGFAGSLSNGGETVTLQTKLFKPIFSFTYSDLPPWPVKADTDGYSLVSAYRNPRGNPAMVEYWVASSSVGGSPMADDLVSGIKPSGINDQGIPLQIFPNPASSDVNLSFYLSGGAKVEIGLVDLSGRFIHRMENAFRAVGNHEVSYPLSKLNLEPGIYLVTLKTANSYTSRRLVYR